ncbi:MAG: DUF3822 family protein [Bacteroidia bacterium]
MQTENNLKLDIQQFADSDYNAESSFRYKYFLLIAQHQMISIIADEQINRIVSFKTFSNNSVAFLNMSYNELREFNEISNEFLPIYKRKTVIIADSDCILVPDTLINLVALETYYKINNSIKENSQVISNKLDFKHLVNVFNVKNETLKFIRFNMPSADIIHQSLLFIKACYISQNVHAETTLFIQVNYDSVDLLQFKNDQVNFSNNFKFDNNTDIVYYVLAVAEELGISGDLNLIVYGEIDSNNSLFALLEKYCKSMQLGKRNVRFTYPNAFENLPEHHYFTALNVLLCE